MQRSQTATVQDSGTERHNSHEDIFCLMTK
jgi:hypothetical protein